LQGVLPAFKRLIVWIGQSGKQIAKKPVELLKSGSFPVCVTARANVFLVVHLHTHHPVTKRLRFRYLGARGIYP
jgi:hypothetical protein